MAIRHVIAIQVAPGRADEFAGAFKAVQAAGQQEDGCEQYELFQSMDEPEKVVLLERWASQELLEQTHGGGAHSRPFSRQRSCGSVGARNRSD